MTIAHHIPEDILIAYSSGSLSEAWSLVVATHLALCPDCRATVSVIDDVGGTLLEMIEQTETDEQAFDRLMRAIDDLPMDDVQPASAKRSVPAILPEPLISYLGSDLHALKWRRLGKGVFHIPITTGDTGVKARMLKVPAGRPVPMHGHKGNELTIVLVGAFHTHQGMFERGDVEVADGSIEHMPVAAPGEDCICLAVTDAPLRFRSIAARVVQKFIGI
ncbi:MAG: ChrR family anti-sigma-E factor [Parvibaculum sp.]|nr:ChrR family anti-sigma-E factor [Parvibaculum sp.]